MSAEPRTDSGQPGRSRRSGRSGSWLLRLGIIGALVTLAGGVLLRTLAAHPFLPVDESANVAYAMQVAHGHIPLAGRHTVQVQFPAQRPAAQHASNHPPLYHALAGQILRLSLHYGHPTAGVVGARLLNLLFAAIAVLLVALLAWTLAAGVSIRGAPMSDRRRAQLAIAAAGLAGALPHLVTAAGIVENDALATALVLGALVMLARLITLGRTPARLAGLAACCAAASLTRVTSVPSVVLMCAVLAVAGWLWPQSAGLSTGRRLGSALWPPAVVLAATAAVAGWFLVLNQHRYGDWSGGKAVEALTHSHEPGSASTVHYLLDPYSWLLQLQQIVGGPDSRHGAYPHSTRPLGWVLFSLLGLGVLGLIYRFAAGRVRIPARSALCIAALAVLFCASMGEIAVHAAGGGLPHGRYLLPAAGAFLLAGAAVLLAYPLRLGPVAVAAALCLECFGTLRAFTVQLHRASPTLSAWDSMRDGLADMSVPAPTVVLVLLLAAMAIGVLLQFGVLAALGWQLPVRRGRTPDGDPVAAAALHAGGHAAPPI